MSPRSDRSLLDRYWPLIAAVTTYWGTMGVVLLLSLHANEGHLVYPLDDAYVHMAMAKNVVLHHVWGVTPFQFTSSTSSPLWTLLLALAYSAVGVNAVTPLVLNVAAGTLIIVTVDRFMRARSARPLLVFAILLVAIFVTPLPALTFSGMEHTLHALVTLWLVFGAADLLASTRSTTVNDLAALALLSALVTGLRYEGLFTVGVVATLFLLSRRFAAAAIVIVLGALPIVASGVWSVRHGWYFLPNSVLLKGQAPSFDPRGLLQFLAGAPALHNLIANPPLLLLVVAALAALMVAVARPVWTEDVFLLAILVGATLLHVQMARVGWFYRYEAYLIVLGISIAGALAAGRMPSGAWLRGVETRAQRVVALALLVVAGFPFASRGANALRNLPTATADIYQQQYQMGTFLHRFYDGRPIALNDIGAVSYLADVKLLDLYGLASLDVARLKLAGRFGRAEIGTLVSEQNVEVAVAYESWLSDYGGVPSGWAKVGEWRVRDNVVLGDSAVSFYATADGGRQPLIENLRRFGPMLPRAVMQAGAYTK